MRYIGDKKAARTSIEARALAELRDVHGKPTRPVGTPKKSKKSKTYHIPK